MRISAKNDDGRDRTGSAWMGWVALYCVLVIIHASVY